MFIFEFDQPSDFLYTPSLKSVRTADCDNIHIHNLCNYPSVQNHICERFLREGLYKKSLHPPHPSPHSISLRTPLCLLIINQETETEKKV